MLILRDVDLEKIEKQLAAEFPPEDIEWRIGVTNNEKNRGLALPYVTNRAIMKRLDAVFGPFGWRNFFKTWQDGAQLCGIGVRVVFEDGRIEWVIKWDGAPNSEIEPIKGGLSDAMKRAAVQWGIGRYLYELPEVWVDIEPRGKSYYIRDYELKRLRNLLKARDGWKVTNDVAPDVNVNDVYVNPQEPVSNNTAGTSGGNVRMATESQINAIRRIAPKKGKSYSDDYLNSLTLEQADALIKNLYKLPFIQENNVANDVGSKASMPMPSNIQQNPGQNIQTQNLENNTVEWCTEGQSRYIAHLLNQLTQRTGRSKQEIFNELKNIYTIKVENNALYIARHEVQDLIKKLKEGRVA